MDDHLADEHWVLGVHQRKDEHMLQAAKQNYIFLNTKLIRT